MTRLLDFSANRLLFCGLALAVFVPLSMARAKGFTVLYNFQGSINSGPDGAYPNGGLIADKAGNL